MSNNSSYIAFHGYGFQVDTENDASSISDALSEAALASSTLTARASALADMGYEALLNEGPTLIERQARKARQWVRSLQLAAEAQEDGKMPSPIRSAILKVSDIAGVGGTSDAEGHASASLTARVGHQSPSRGAWLAAQQVLDTAMARYLDKAITAMEAGTPDEALYTACARVLYSSSIESTEAPAKLADLVALLPAPVSAYYLPPSRWLISSAQRLWAAGDTERAITLFQAAKTAMCEETESRAWDVLLVCENLGLKADQCQNWRSRLDALDEGLDLMERIAGYKAIQEEMA